MSRTRRPIARSSSAAVVAGLLALLTGCGSSGSDAETIGDPVTDKLAQVLERGTIVLATDLDYAPQSFAVEGAARQADTRCATDERTASEVSGFDAETAKLVAERLGVEPCFVAPSWVEITAGSWGERWDLAIVSGAIEQSREATLAFTRPYYVMPAYAFVHEDSSFQTAEDLSRRRVGACTSCTHEAYLRGTLELAHEGPVEPVIVGAQVVTYAVEAPGLADVAAAELDGFVCAEQVGVHAIGEGLALRSVGEALFVEHGTAWADRGSELAIDAFVERVDAIVGELHADGSLRRFSEQFFGEDYAGPAEDFDMAAVGQGP